MEFPYSFHEHFYHVQMHFLLPDINSKPHMSLCKPATLLPKPFLSQGNLNPKAICPYITLYPKSYIIDRGFLGTQTVKP